MSGDAPQLRQTYSFGRFTVDVAHQRLLRDGDAVPLTSKVFDTLVPLVLHRDRFISKEELIATVWGGASVSDDSLFHNISLLRRVLGDDSACPRYIATSSGRGYRFIADLTDEPAGAQPRSPREPGPAPDSATPEPHAIWRQHRVAYWVGLCAVILLMIGGAITAVRDGSPKTAPLNRQIFSPEMPPGYLLLSGGVLSPNGRWLAFVASSSTDRRLWVRDLESGETRNLAGTEASWAPFWSPDSEAIGFFAGSRIRRVGVWGEPNVVIGTTIGSKPAGASWSASHIIVYSDAGSLYAIPDSGGAPALVRAPNRVTQEIGLSWPQFLPDGRHFLYSLRSADSDADNERSGTYFGAVGSGESIRVLPESGPRVTYAAPGYLLFVRDHQVVAQAFNPATGFTGEARVPVIDSAVQNVSLSASADGLLAFGGGASERLAWFDRAGRRLSSWMAPALHNLALSRDETQLLGTIGGEAWLIELQQGTATRSLNDAFMPYWSADAKHIAFTTARGNQSTLYVRSTDADLADQLVFKSGERKFMNDWTADGRYMIFVSYNPNTKQDLWVLPTYGDRTPRPFLNTPANEVQGQVSPNGDHIAYASDESGQLEVYLDSFPTPGARIVISNGGGGQPQWRRDGRELFYLAASGSLMAVDVNPSSLKVGAPRALFQVRLPGNLLDSRNYYTPTGDGQHFLITSLDDEAAAEPIRVLTNWAASLHR